MSKQMGRLATGCALVLGLSAVYFFACADRAPREPEEAARPAEEEVPREAGEEEIPQFPWPPPKASASVNIPAAFFTPTDAGTLRFREVDRRLSAALDASGYAEKSYYGIPGGFALVTRLEQINDDGSPKPAPARWNTDVKPLGEFSLRAYLRALFSARVGYYRILVFAVTDVAFAQQDTTVSQEEAMEWLYGGLNRLPRRLAARLFTPDHACTALIYEFIKPETDDPYIKLPGRLTGKMHLQRANLWTELER